MGRWSWRAGLVALLLTPAPLAGQLAPLSAPAGSIRLELAGGFESWDHRYRDGSRESWAAAFQSDALGVDLIPSLAATNTLLSRVTGDPSAAAVLGRSRADAEINRDIGIVGLGVGVTNRLTIFGRVPAVRVRTQANFRINDDPATVGFNPASAVFGTPAGQAQDAEFFSQFGQALTSLDQQIAAGAYDADPARRAAAQATLAEATALRNDLFDLLADPSGASPFAPLAYGDLGHAVTARIDALQATLAQQFGVTGFEAAPALAAGPLDAAQFQDYLSRGGGPIAALNLGQLTTARPGDAEIGAAYTLIDRWDRTPRSGGIRVALEGLFRLATGRADNPLHFLDAGTGDHQPDIQGRMVVDLGTGLLGARLEGRYNRQLAATQIRLVASPFHPVVSRSALASLRIDPGDETAVSVSPFVRLGRSFGFLLGVDYTHRGADQVSYADPSAAGTADPLLVAEGSAFNVTVIRAGFSFADPARLRPGGSGLPIDASWSWERVVAASGGIVPQRSALRARLRLYLQVF